jgi:hypothetical protein
LAVALKLMTRKKVWVHLWKREKRRILPIHKNLADINF